MPFNIYTLGATTIPPAHWLQAIMGPAPISLPTYIVTLHQGRCRIGFNNQWHSTYPDRRQRRGVRSA